MTDPYDTLVPDAASCSDHREEALTLFIDGELPFAAQPALFAHLAGCDHCRRTLSTMLEFRRMSRQEILTVPTAVDDALFQRIDAMKRRSKRIDRYADRRPLWQVRAPVSLRVATVAGMLLFLAGLAFPQNAGQPVSLQTRLLVESTQEQVELATPPPPRIPHFWIYPGLTIEAARID